MLVGGVILLLTVLVLSAGFHRRMRARVARAQTATTASWSYIHPDAPWREVKVKLDEAIQTAQYKDGAKVKASVNLTPESASSLFYRLMIDLLRSLTPRQVAVIEHRPLPYTDLSPNQQALLNQFPKATTGDKLHSHARESRLWIAKYIKTNKKQGYMFNWEFIDGPGFGGTCGSLDSRY